MVSRERKQRAGQRAQKRRLRAAEEQFRASRLEEQEAFETETSHGDGWTGDGDVERPGLHERAAGVAVHVLEGDAAEALLQQTGGAGDLTAGEGVGRTRVVVHGHAAGQDAARRDGDDARRTAAEE